MSENNGNILEDVRNLLNRHQANLGWGPFGSWLEERIRPLERLTDPFSRIEKSAIELAKGIGLSTKSIQAFADRTMAVNSKLELSTKYNISTEEIIGLQSNLMSAIGRNVAIDQVGSVVRGKNGEEIRNYDSELENVLAARQVFGDKTVADMVAGFDKLGISMKTAAKATGKLFQEAGKYGINLTKYAENLTSNLSMAQNYNFRNGIDGLKEMARKATEIRQDMKDIASFVEKVSTVGGAIESASKLQVLGGSFASLSNPLAMLNESLTNMEGLQDRFTKMTENAAFYDKSSHQIRMTAYNRMRIKAAAEAMGVNPSNMIDQAYAQARRGEIESQMNAYGNFREDVKKLLPNVGEIDQETGVAGATINGEFKTLREISADPKLQEQLVRQSKSESDDIKEIAQDVRGIYGKLTGKISQIANEEGIAVRNEGIYNNMSSYELTEKALAQINEKTMATIRTMDTAANNLETLVESVLTRGLALLYQPFSTHDPEKRKSEVERIMKELLGEGYVPEQAGKLLGSILKGITEEENRIFAAAGEHGATVRHDEEVRAGYVVPEGRKGSIPQEQGTTAFSGKQTSTYRTQQVGSGGNQQTIVYVIQPAATQPGEVPQNIAPATGTYSSGNNPVTPISNSLTANGSYTETTHGNILPQNTTRDITISAVNALIRPERLFVSNKGETITNIQDILSNTQNTRNTNSTNSVIFNGSTPVASNFGNTSSVLLSANEVYLMTNSSRPNNNSSGMKRNELAPVNTGFDATNFFTYNHVVAGGVDENGIIRVDVKPNEETMPGMPVSRSTNQTTTNSYSRMDESSKSTLEVNVNGTFKFVGESGKEITKKELEELLDKNNDLKLAIAKLITDAAKEIERKRGQI